MNGLNEFGNVLEMLAHAWGQESTTGEIMLPLKGDGQWGTVKVTRTIVVNEPTKEKIFKILRDVRNANFRGNVHLPCKLEDPFVITLEEFRETGRRLLMESRY